MSATASPPGAVPPGGARGRLRLLVACGVCERQFDATGHRPGDRVRCLCGESLVVPRPRTDEVVVARCSSCGAPRRPGASTCAFCHAPFALDERARNTICPLCANRIPDHARFCPVCGLRIDPHEIASTPTAMHCPACGTLATLASRAFGEPAGNALECRRCGGLWLGIALFRELERRAHERVSEIPAPPARREVAPGKVFYRPCPECGDRMLRRNYGKRSGVVLDLCVRHGLWFDADELAQVLAWIRSGALDRSRERDAEEVRESERRHREERLAGAGTDFALPTAGDGGGPEPPFDLIDIARLLYWLFGLGAALVRAIRR